MKDVCLSSEAVCGRLVILLLGVGVVISVFGCAAEPAEVGSEDAAAEAADATSEEAPPGGPPGWILAANAQPRGVVTHEAGAGDELMLFSQLTSNTDYLIDRAGNVVNTWTSEFASGSSYFMDNGDLLHNARIAEPPNFRAGGVMGYVQRLSWEGELLWEWRVADEDRILHHDIEPMPNGNLLVIGWEQISEEAAIAAGRQPALTNEQGLWSEWIAEIEPVPPNDAKIVWEWRAFDHLVQNHDPDAPNYGEPSEHPHRLDINADAGGPEIDEEELERLKALGYVPADATTQDVGSDFLHMNSIDYHPELDQILVSIPELGEIWILDHSTTTEQARGSTGGRSGHGGDLIYRWGNPSAYGRGPEDSKRIFYQHQAEWVPEGVAGTGNITLFDNGQGRPAGEWSAILEITPPLSNGTYPLAEGSAWGPEDVTWEYTAEEKESFFSPFISGVRKLESGNLLVCSGAPGRFFEVTPDKQIVWEYRNPFHGDVPGWNPPGTEDVPYGTFRVTPVPRDHPGLAGRTLQPLDPQPEAYIPPPREAPPAG